MRRTFKRAQAATDTVTDRIPEWRLQAEAVAGLDELLAANPGTFAYAASLEGVKLTQRQALDAKAQGMQAGEPDLRIYLPGGRVEGIELKGEGGRLTDSQKVRHPILAALGVPVAVIAAKTPEQMRALVVAHVRARAGI